MNNQRILLITFVVSWFWTMGSLVQEPTTHTVFSYNPLLLNDKPLDLAQFTIGSRGMLAVVSGNPNQPAVTKAAFRIYLRRANTVVRAGASDSDRTVSGIQIGDVLALALPGDELVIEPVRPNDQWTRQVIKLKGTTFTPVWFAALKKGDGC